MPIGQSTGKQMRKNIRFIGRGGKRYCWLLGHCGALAPEEGPEYPPLTYSTHHSSRFDRPLRFLQTITLPTATARVLILPAHHPGQPPAPSLHHWDMSVVTLSHGKGSGDVTNTIDSDQQNRLESSDRRAVFLMAFYGVVFLFSFSMSSSLNTTNQIWKNGGRCAGRGVFYRCRIEACECIF